MRRVLIVGLLVLVLGVGIGVVAYPQTADPAPANISAVTKEMLEQRLVELQRGHDQAVANANAYSGAIQECQYWLDKMKATPPPREEPKKP